MVLVSDKPRNAISILQTKLSHREGHEPRRIRLEAMPLNQYIEERHREREPCLKIRPRAVHDFLEVADERQHRQDRLHQHAILPLAALTEFQIGGIALRGMEGGITQDNHPPINLLNQPLKRVIRDIGRGTGPPHDQSPLIEEQTQFPADNPAMVRHAFAADLLRTAAFAYGVNQLDAVGVNDPKHGRRSQEGLRPVLMGLQQTKEPRPLGQAGKQWPIVARQPAIEGPVTHAFQRMQQPQGDDLTGPEVRLRMFGKGAQLLIDLIEQRGDKLDGDHGLLRAWQGVTLSTSMEEVHDQYNKASKYYCILLVYQRLTPLVCRPYCAMSKPASSVQLRPSSAWSARPPGSG